MQRPHNFQSSFVKIEQGRGNKMSSIENQFKKKSFSAKIFITPKYDNMQTLFKHHTVLHTAYVELHRM